MAVVFSEEKGREIVHGGSVEHRCSIYRDFLN
jgi:hypothetical protein